MPYIPHTEKEIKDMLQTIGVDSVQKLFTHDKKLAPKHLPEIKPLDEKSLNTFFQNRDSDKKSILKFLGGGNYDHFLPSAVESLSTRSEFLNAYTPYQPEVSQR